MSIFRRDKGPEEDDNQYIRIPDTSTLLGPAGHANSAVLIRNIAYDAKMGKLADKVMSQSYGMPPVSDEGRKSLIQDSASRVEKVIACHDIIDIAVEIVFQLLSANSSDRLLQGGISQEDLDAAMDFQADVAARCVLSTLSALVDLGMMTPNFGPVAIDEETWGE